MTKKLIVGCILLLLIPAGLFTCKKTKSINNILTGGVNDIIIPYPEHYVGTVGMMHYLEEEYTHVNVMENKFSNTLRLHKFLEMPMPKNPEEALQLKGSIAREYLNTGQTLKAIEVFNEYFSIAKELQVKPKEYMFYKHMHALAYMRYGEIENCSKRHNAESCLFPIQGDGIHVDKTGSEGGIAIYLEILKEAEKNSEDYLIALWLLNIAHMTLGTYPDGVPAEYRIDPEKIKSEYEMPKFTDVAMQAGVALNSLSGGVCLDDFNNDGYLDIITSGWQFYEQLTYYENNKDGTFTDKTEAAKLKGLPGGLNMLHADYDNDGDKDVFVLRGAWWDKFGCTPNSLLRNNGNGTFDDVTKEAGVLSLHPTNSARFEDFDNDGWLDLFVGNEATEGSNNHPCELFMNNKNGTFTNQAKEANCNIKGYVKGVATGDYDNDGYVDIFLSVFQSKNNVLLRNVCGENNGQVKFEDVTEMAGINKPENCFPTWFVDYDNDGWLDLFVASFDNETLYQVPAHYMGVPYPKDYSALYHNNGDGTFTDVGEYAGFNLPVIAMGSNFGDIDNDGYNDFYLGTGNPDFRSLIPNLMFRNQGGKYFQNVTTSAGFGHLQKGHAVGFGDIDMDGDQDIYAVLGGALQGDFFFNALFENPGNENKWITIFPKGTVSNLDGIGARIKLIVVDRTGRTRTIHHVVNSGGSFGSGSLRAEIGLGNALKIRELEIYWPASKTRQVFKNVSVNQYIEITEKKDTFAVLNFPAFQFSHDHMEVMDHDMMLEKIQY
jgi:hypothetical protein